MNTISKHIDKYLDVFIQEPDDGFDAILESIPGKRKTRAKSLLVYLDKVINKSLNLKVKELKYIHIHIEDIQEEMIELLAQFIIIKFFNMSMKKNISNSTNKAIKEEIDSLSNTLSKPVVYKIPTKCSKARWKIIKEERAARVAGLKRRIGFLENIINVELLSPKTIVNLPIKIEATLQERFQYTTYAIPPEKLEEEYSFCLMNTEKSRDDIDGIKYNNDKYLLDEIENIVLFNCEQKQLHSQFNFKELKEWNENHGTCFKNLIIFSFNSGNFRFNKLKNRLDRISSRYYIQTKGLEYPTYTVLPCEVNKMLYGKELDNIRVSLYVDKESSFWEDFILNIQSFEGLYELRSLKMMNIYSLVFNDTIKEIILSDVFSKEEPSKFVRRNTWDTIQELSDDDISLLKQSLSNTMDQIIESDWAKEIQGQIAETTTIILPELVLKNKVLVSHIKRTLELSTENRLTSWFEVDFDTLGEVLILDYRDLGPFPYSVQPSLFENLFSGSKRVSGFFIRLFFEDKFNWMKYNLNRDLAKVLQDEIRDDYFYWNDLSDQIQDQKPDKPDISWSLDDSYQSNITRLTMRVKYKEEEKVLKYDPAELFIVEQGHSKQYSVLRLDELSEFDPSEDVIEIQRLDDIYKDFNIYEKIANVEREKAELKVISKNFNVEKIDTAKLWKILLKNKTTSSTEEEIYNEFKERLKQKGLRIVSFNHFKKNWLDPESKGLTPREKKVFFELCKYLKLPITYFRILLRMRNVEMQSTKTSSKQMDRLLTDIINDGCFNIGEDSLRILKDNRKKYIEKHDFDEIGISSEQVAEELKGLVDLLKPFIKTRQVEYMQSE